MLQQILKVQKHYHRELLFQSRIYISIGCVDTQVRYVTATGV